MANDRQQLPHKNEGKEKQEPSKKGFLFYWRRRWDSNPRALADNRISSFQRYGVYERIAHLYRELNGHQKVSIFKPFETKFRENP